MQNLVLDIERGYVPDSSTTPYQSIFREYERVVLESLITSFGLDFLIKDQYGGDVDTIHNVRNIGRDSQMYYKNKYNESTYNSQAPYSRSVHDEWHRDRNSNFAQTKHQARERFQNLGELINDDYDGGSLYITKAKGIPPSKRAELDHIISTHEIYTDRGRVLSGENGKLLADQTSNFAWTNKSRNASMGKKTNREYVDSHPELPEETKRRILQADEKARKAYDQKINRAYYTSKSFMSDCIKASGGVAAKMGLRQALGLVFYEIWHEVRVVLTNRAHDGESLFKSIGSGVKQGLSNAKVRYKEIWSKFIEGSVSGLLSSLTTTLCNIFFTTAKSIVKIIRQSWASLVEAVKILLFNPDCLPFGERFRAGAKVLATGASVIVGTTVGELVSQTGVGAIPVIGNIVVTFCGTLVTGILSCSLLYLLDKNPIINAVVEFLNNIPTVDDHVRYFKQQAVLLDAYCAELMNIDFEKYKREVNAIKNAVSGIINAKNDCELNLQLHQTIRQLNIVLPYDKSQGFDKFMGNRNNTLVFR
ncbi:MAG: hypothetical protein K2K75_09545 [Muribaculaceae bacterium]|nr:hypothetical protein [Muribaculaceae bacterium]